MDTCHWGMWGGGTRWRYMQIRLRYGDNRPLEVDKRRCCAIFPANCNLSRMQKREAERRSNKTPLHLHLHLHHAIQIRRFTSPISDCDTAGTVRLSLRSSVWGNKEGSVWTAANTFAHSGSPLAVSTSSPGVSHTRLTSCFCQKPRQLLSSLHGNRALVAEVCCLHIANHPLGQLYLFLIQRHLRLTSKPNRQRPFKGMSCEGLGGGEKDLHSVIFFSTPLKKTEWTNSLCFHARINRTDWPSRKNEYFWVRITSLISKTT